MSFFAELQKILDMARSILPIVALTNPNAATGIASAEAVMTAVQPLVNAGEAISQQAVAAGQPALTGPQKLQMAQTAVQTAVTMAQQSGVTTATFDQHWAAINPAITAVCAASKALAVPVAPAQ